MQIPILGSICLIAGTAIGAGMLALPLTISGVGLIGGALLMVAVWFILYLASICALELSIRTKQELTIGGLGHYFSGPVAQFLGDASILVLNYSLMTAYLFGGASILGILLNDYTPSILSFASPVAITLIFIVIILLGPVRLIDFYNRILFIVMILAMGVFLLYPTLQLKETATVIPESFWFNLSSWQKAIPVVFTSFGYHGILSMMARYCHYDPKALKKVVFWGSFIPLLVYLLWIVVSILVISSQDPFFYHTLLTENVELGQFIMVLGKTLGHNWLRQLSWAISFLAIITSTIGVGLTLIGQWEQFLAKRWRGRWQMRFFILLFILLPTFVVGNYVPQVFIAALGFAGLMLANIAIFLPLYLLYKSNNRCLESTTVYFPMTQSIFFRILILLLGIVVVYFEIKNIFI